MQWLRPKLAVRLVGVLPPETDESRVQAKFLQKIPPRGRGESRNRTSKDEIIKIRPSVISPTHREEIYEQNRTKREEERHNDDIAAQVERF